MRDLPDVEYYMPLDRDRLSEEGRKNIERNSRQNGNTVELSTVDNDSVTTVAPHPGRNRVNGNNADIDDEEDDVIFVDVENRRRQ